MPVPKTQTALYIAKRLMSSLLQNFRQLGRRIFLHFDTTPENIELINYRFYIVSNIGQTIAWSSHLLWLFMFWAMGFPVMAVIQIFSILCYVIAISLNRRGLHLISMTISLAEIVVHQGLAVHFLGWECGFQYFIPVIAIFPLLIPKGNKIWQWGILVFCLLGYLYIDFFLKNTLPVYHLSPHVLNYFKISNITLSFGCFALWALYLTQAINRSQNIIEEKTKALTQAEEASKQAEIQLKLELKEKENILITKEKEQNEALLLNVLPREVALELIEKGRSEARIFHEVTVLFTDFKDFTRISEQMTPEQLVKEIDYCFSTFDKIIQPYRIEKIKTIGDSYMCVSGLPSGNPNHATDMVRAALEIRDFMLEYRNHRIAEGGTSFEIRLGINSGTVVAGIVGVKKFAYDIWGDTVNLASRMESSSDPGKVNISGSTYALVKDFFHCTHRGKISAKSKGEIDMYFAEY